MDGESQKLVEDCFLRTIVDSRSTNGTVVPPPSKAPVKVEMQILRLGTDSQNMVMETLRYIHGDDFKLDDISNYKDKGSRLKKNFWQERGNLIVQSVTDYSQLSKNPTDPLEKFRMYSLIKLESYGFHKTHCIEALDHCIGEIPESLALLSSKYFPNNQTEKPEVPYTVEELIEMRVDEKSSLESIYDTSFEEKEKNTVWLLKFQIDHLLVHSPSEMKKKVLEKKQQAEDDRKRKTVERQIKNKLERCRNFLKGNCKYGERCRYVHETLEDLDKEKKDDGTLDPNLFYLEIRFPKDCLYPYEPPLIFLKTTCADIPHSLCLRINRRLVQEAQSLAHDGMPSIYSIAELLQMDEEIDNFIKQDRYKFISASKSLFFIEDDDNDKNDPNASIQNFPSHYTKGSTGRSDAINNNNPSTKLRENMIILRKFLEKRDNQNYKKMLEVRRNLPAWGKMDDILNVIEKSQVVVISGETGCGKSTQVPQFLLDDWLLNASQLDKSKQMSHVEIICTQPRRLSAIGVAERVSDERNERVGNTVGYQIRLENKISSNTRLTFCTTGILLRRLQSDPMLESVSHIIVDEVHERSEESDFLLLILKKLLRKRKDLKVILMSATLNSKLFSEYFDNAPVLDIPGRTFPVEQLFLEDILDRSGFVIEPDSQYCRKFNKKQEEELLQELEYADVMAENAAPPKSIRDENLTMPELYARYSDYAKVTCKTLYLLDPLKINPELIDHVLKFIVDGDHEWPREGTILVFLPGLAEIQTIYDALNDSSTFSPRAGKYILVPLHSTLTSEEQALVFKRAPSGKRKIVLSTNIAETSVTIDDCVFVIDCGQMKEKKFDSNRNMESLDVVWVSRANAMQRKGRAGRVMPGVCIHLFTGHRYSNHILSQPIPEIHRVPLEQLLLRIKTLPNFQNDQLKDVLMNTIEPPSEENVSSAIRRLQDVGAFDLEENLTPLGHHLAALPVDVRIGKLMLFGTIFQCIDSVLTVAACLSFKTPFVSPFSKRSEADNKKRQFAISSSDHLTVLNAYKRWKDVNKRSRYAGQVYAEENFLSWKTLHTLGEIKLQFLELLVSIGFVPIDLTNRNRRFVQDEILEITGTDLNMNSNNNRLLAALLSAALYPNIVKVLTPEKSFTMSMGGAIPRQPLPSELRFKTRDDGYVFLHPSSVNSTVGNFNSPFMVYQEKVKTSRLYIRECTMIPLLPLVLFSGSDIRIELHGGDFIILLEDGWIVFQASSHNVAEMVKYLRLELMKILEEKIRDPLLNLLHHDNGKKIISTIVYLLTKE